MAKYFQWEITTAGLSFQRDPERIARDAALDGIYVLRTSLPAQRLDPAQTVRSYKQLAKMVGRYEPPLDIEPFFTKMPKILESTMKDGKPKSLAAYLRFAIFMDDFAATTRPKSAFAAAIFAVSAFVGRLAGLSRWYERA